MLPALIENALADDVVYAHLLATFEFRAGTRRLWLGEGRLNVPDLGLFDGIGAFGSISTIEQSIGASAPAISFTLSGVDANIIAAARNARNDVKGRKVFLDVAWWARDGVTYLGRKTLAVLVMDRMIYKSTAFRDEDGVAHIRREISVSAEYRMGARRFDATYSAWTQFDQAQRYPTDKGLEFGGTQRYKELLWPTF